MISKAICCVSGTCSDGLRMNVLPQPMAKGRNQYGTIAGKLNGTIAAHTPDGLAHGLGVDVARDVLEHAALHRRRDRARALDHLDHPRHLGAGVDERLAHLRRHRPGHVVGAGGEGLAHREQVPGAVDHAHRAPLGQGRPRRLHGGVEVGRTRERDPREHLPGGRVGHVERLGRRLRGRPGAADVVVEQSGGGWSGHRTAIVRLGCRGRSAADQPPSASRSRATSSRSSATSASSRSSRSASAERGRGAARERGRRTAATARGRAGGARRGGHVGAPRR